MAELPAGYSIESVPVSNNPERGSPGLPAGYAVESRPDDIGLLESFGRGAVEGATFGFDDKLGFSKDRREQSRKANPWTHFAGEIVGGIAPIAASGGAGAGLRAGAAVADAAGLTRLARAGTGIASGVEAAFLPGKISGIGTAALQGSKLGAVSGGLSGAGHADVNDYDTAGEAAYKRGMGALTGTAVGTALGAPIGVAGHAIGRAAQHTLGARAAADAETKAPMQGALRAIQRGLERDRVTPDQLVSQIRAELPASSADSARRKLTPEMVETLVERANRGDAPSDIAATLGVAEDTVRKYMSEISERSIGPLNLIDRAALARPGAGENTQWTMRAAANTPGEARGIAKENLLERQIGALGRIQQNVGQFVGTLDFDTAAANHASKLEQASEKAYGTAKAASDAIAKGGGRPLGDLEKVVKGHLDEYIGDTGERADAVRKIIGQMFPETTPASGNLMMPPDLTRFIRSRGKLRGAIDVAQREGNSDVISGLVKLKKDIDAEVSTANPAWWQANQIYRDGKAAEDAMEAGANMSLRLGNPTRENMEFFRTAAQMKADGLKARAAATKAKDAAAVETANGRIEAADATMDLYRVGLARSINDRIMNSSETANLVREMLLPAAQQNLREILGNKAADEFIRRLRAERSIVGTFQSLFGAQTQPLKAATDDLNWAQNFTGSWHNLGLGKAAQLVAQWHARSMGEARNNAMLPLMVETDPTKQLQLLRSLQRIDKARQIGDQTIRRPAIASSGTIANASTAELLPKPKSDQVKAEGRYLSQARNAMARGASRADVEQRLRSLGVDPRKL